MAAEGNNRGAFTAFNIVQWFRWADEPDSDVVKEMRTDRVQRHLFPDGLDDDERARRERAVERARAMAGDGEQLGGWPEPFPPPGDEIKAPPAIAPPLLDDDAPEWQGLIPRSSRAYRRGSTHDGTQQRVDELRTRSSGSPFDAEEPAPPPRLSPMQKALRQEALARRERELARRSRR